jgi:hypothetical protein
MIFIGLVTGFVASISFQLISKSFFEKKFVVARPRAIVANHLNLYANKLSEKEKENYAVIFSKGLDESIADLLKDGVVVIVSDAVLGGLPDYTEIIEKMVDKKINKGRTDAPKS